MSICQNLPTQVPHLIPQRPFFPLLHPSNHVAEGRANTTFGSQQTSNQNQSRRRRQPCVPNQSQKMIPQVHLNNGVKREMVSKVYRTWMMEIVLLTKRSRLDQVKVRKSCPMMVQTKSFPNHKRILDAVY